jgi:hypothetical protein
MAIYYVRPDGNDANTGTGSTTVGAWQTITKAIGASGIAPGDTLYIAPGVYRGTFTAAFTNPTSEGQRITIAGDPTASQFSGIAAGDVIITNYLGDTTVPANGTTLTIAKNYVTITKIRLQGYNAATLGEDVLLTGGKFIIYNCVFESMFQSVSNGQFTVSVGIPQSVTGFTFYNNFVRGQVIVYASGTYSSNTDMDARIYSNTIINTKQTSNPAISTFISSANVGGIKIYNNILIGNYGFINTGTNASTTFKIELYNNQIFASVVGIQNVSTASIVENYNNINATSARTNCNAGANSYVNSRVALDLDYSRITGIATLPTFAPAIGSINRNAGTNTYVPSTDFFGVSWLTPSTPTIGSVEYSAVTTAGQYNPTERNASAITIAPASTSQSIELYLGTTGLTFSTSGLAAYYVRNQSAPVAITLVTQTPTGAWTSGGFAEISSSLVPGVYRLDVPNAAFAAGASDVTIVVRGASGTNGAVLTVTLSSGGLTEAQTAGAVWNAVRATYPTAGTFGEYVNVNVNSGAIADAVWDEARSGHTTVGTFGQYVNAELVTPVTSAALVRMGPFEVRADGLGASDPLDIQKGAQHGIDIQCVDNNGSGIDITSATVTAKVYNSGATLVDTYACTATYAADGRATFTIDTTVTNVPGTYTATITRTTGASDTQVFGPLRIYVRDI